MFQLNNKLNITIITILLLEYFTFTKINFSDKLDLPLIFKLALPY